MYRGFNLDIGTRDFSEFVTEGNTIHNRNKSLVKQKLDSFKDKNGNLLATHYREIS